MIDSKSPFHAEFKSVGGQKISSGEIFLQAVLVYDSLNQAGPGPPPLRFGALVSAARLQARCSLSAP